MRKTLIVFLALFVLAPVAAIKAQIAALDIRPEQLIVLNGDANAEALFDEKELFINKHFPTASAQSFFKVTDNQIYLPQEILIPLEALFRLDSVWFYDGAGKDRVEILIGDPKLWQAAADFKTDRYNQWQSFPLKGEGEYLLLRFYSSQSQIGELRFFGSRIGPGKEKTAHATHFNKRPKTVRQIFGVNAFVDDPLIIVEPVASSIREYHNWDWDEANGDLNYKPRERKEFAWSPSYVAGWDFDSYYRDAKEMGISVFPCLQGSAKPYRGEADFNSKPYYRDYKADNPQAYRDYAEYVFQFAARYGGTAIDGSLLLLKQDQRPLLGLDLIAGIEAWNEPDKWWKGREGYFHPFEYAAFLSATYDGHEGRMGPKVGLKKADSNLPMIMGGLAETNLDYLLAIKHWSDYNRKGDFPAQVLNFHHYSNNAGGQNGNASAAISPERDSLKERLEKLVIFRERNFPLQEVWLSEFGYDSNPKSPQGTPAIGPWQADEVQAVWLLRTYLAIAASGLDRAHLYMLRDVNAPNPNKYNSSGLRAEKWNKHAPKPSYIAIRSLLALLGDYYFVQRIEQEEKDVYLYEFASKTKAKHIYALWLGTESAKQLFNYSLKVPTQSLKLWELDEAFQWKQTPKTISNGVLPIKVTEKPIFLEWSD